MDKLTTLLFIVAILTVGFIFVAKRYDYTIATIKSFLFSARFEGKKMGKKNDGSSTGEVEVSGIAGKNIKVGKVVGAQGDDVTQGKAKVSNLAASEDVIIDHAVGLDQTNQ